jgi:two-component system, chemotaxis family, sensor kinase CheA
MSTITDPEMQEIFEGFVVETTELLDSLAQDLMILESQPDDFELLNKIFRSFHTIKGTSSFMGFDTITRITHHAEDILNKLRKSELPVSRPIIDVLLEVHDWIETLMSRLTEGDDSPVDYSETIETLEKLKDPDYIESTNITPNEIFSNSTENNSIEIDDEEKAISALDSVLSNSDLVNNPGDFTDDELALLDAAFAEVNNTFFEESKLSKAVITETKENNEIIEDIHDIKISEPATVPNNQPTWQEIPEPKKLVPQVKTDDKKNVKTMKAAGETIRVDVERVESLMDLSGELVLGRNRLAQITDQIEQEFEKVKSVRDLMETTAQIDFVTSEIQSAVMRMRMVPVGKLYQKAPRIVRDLSKEFGKKIKLIVKGEETEIDRGIIEELNDPLVHMIRNSCDHGISTPVDRIKEGKPEEGTITLDAEQEGNAIVLRITDDGRGLDPEKLKDKAISKGILTEEQAQLMSKREALQLIFMPGFSTAAKVTSVSGRGVGMDVVRTNIQNLKGMIEIESEVGIGTTFVLKLPLTLAIIQGLLVKVSNETYAIPLNSVVEVVSVNLDSIYTVNKMEVIRLRNDVYPLMRLSSVLSANGKDKSLENRYIVVVGMGHQRVGFVVDELLGQQEIVIKSLGEYLGHISGIAGSTILGDGRVIMIIDVAELIQFSVQNTLAISA